MRAHRLERGNERMGLLEGCLRKLSVRVRLVLVFTLVLAAVSGILVYYATEMMSAKLLLAAQQKLQSDLAMGRQILEARYPGDWQIINGRLYKGPVLMEGNSGVVDQIGDLTGNTCTIFRGDTGVATSVVQDGQRVIDTRLSEEIAQVLLVEGQAYTGKAEVAGVWSQAAFEPIKDARGITIGIWCVGTPLASHEEAIYNYRLTMISYAAIGVLLGFLIALLLSCSVCAPLRRISQVVEKAGQGDLSQRIPDRAKDEPGKLASMLNALLEKITGLTVKNSQGLASISKSSTQLGQLAESSNALISNLNTQAEALLRSATEQAQISHHSRTAIGEMAAGYQQLAAGLQETARAVAAVSTKAEEGEGQVELAVKQTAIISSSTDYTASVVAALGEKASQIGPILDMMNDLASQGNLLALNAAIEAARAGEMGRGFAVVADQVRALAEQSAEAAQRIAELKNELHNEVDQAARAVQEGSTEAVRSTAIISRAGDAFHHVSAAIKQVKAQLEELSRASRQMAAGLDTAMQSADNNQAAAQHNAQMVEAMSEIAGRQMEEIGKFKQALNALNRAVADLQQASAHFKL